MTGFLKCIANEGGNGMFEHRSLSTSQFKKYEVDAEDFELYEGDQIPPGYEIGIDVRSGAAVYLTEWGQVATAYYHPMNHSFLVMIQMLPHQEDLHLPEQEMVPA
jgi:hypothetical protein